MGDPGDMPRFFFDTSDGSGWRRDEEGVDFPDLAAAREDMMRAIAELARDVLPDGNRRDFVILMRDEAGRSILRATLALSVEPLT